MTSNIISNIISHRSLSHHAHRPLIQKVQNRKYTFSRTPINTFITPQCDSSSSATQIIGAFQGGEVVNIWIQLSYHRPPLSLSHHCILTLTNLLDCLIPNNSRIPHLHIYSRIPYIHITLHISSLIPHLHITSRIHHSHINSRIHHLHINSRIPYLHITLHINSLIPHLHTTSRIHHSHIDSRIPCIHIISLIPSYLTYTLLYVLARTLTVFRLLRYHWPELLAPAQERHKLEAVL